MGDVDKDEIDVDEDDDNSVEDIARYVLLVYERARSVATRVF